VTASGSSELHVGLVIGRRVFCSRCKQIGGQLGSYPSATAHMLTPDELSRSGRVPTLRQMLLTVRRLLLAGTVQPDWHAGQTGQSIWNRNRDYWHQNDSMGRKAMSRSDIVPRPERCREVY